MIREVQYPSKKLKFSILMTIQHCSTMSDVLINEGFEVI